MTGIDVLKYSLQLSQNILNALLSEVSDADLQTRPVPQSNTLGWQLGHIISSEPNILKEFPAFQYPAFPPGFVEKHANKPEVHSHEGSTGFTVADYQAQLNAIRGATLAGLSKLTDKDLDQPVTGQMKELAPTLGGLLEMASQHFMMHSGHISVIRRKLGKKVLF